MAMTNAQIQAAYRARNKNPEGDRRLDLVINSASLTALKRMAAHYRVTQRAMLQTLIGDAQTALLGSLDGGQQDAYYDRVQAK
jgi:hypothetical protein